MSTPTNPDPIDMLEPSASPAVTPPAKSAGPGTREWAARSRVPWLPVGAFVLVAFGLAWLICIPLWRQGGLQNGALLQISASAMMFMPMIATLVAMVIQRKFLRQAQDAGLAQAAGQAQDAEAGRALPGIARYLGLWPLRPARRVVGMTFLTAFAVILLITATLVLANALGWADLDLVRFSGFRKMVDATPMLASMGLAAAIAIQLASTVLSALFTAIFAFGEEVGWRGWLLQSLRPLGTWPALLISGAIWGLWHAPLILLGYNFARPNLGGLALMVGGCIALGVLFGWTRLRTGSIWPAVLGHGVVNTFTGALLIITLRDGATPDGAFVSLLGFPGWIVIGIVVIVLVATGQFKKQPELGAPA